MPTTTTEYQGSSSMVSMAFRGRSILSLRRNQVVSMEHGQEQELEDLDLFQTHVADRLLSLLASTDQTDRDEILSLSFLQKIMDAFLSWEEDFKAILLLILARNPDLISKPPIERLLSDLLDRAVKSLDILNAATDSVHSLGHWNRHADIAASAVILPHRHRPIPLGDGQLGRAKKALEKLLLASSPPDPHHHHHHHESGSGSGSGGRTERAWSFGRNLGNREGQNSRSLSGSASRGWSAARQVQSMAAHLAAPRGGDAGCGAAAALGLAVYTMSSVLVFTMWTLVAAFPSQERGGHAGFGSPPVAPPRHLAWAAAMIGIQERIAEEGRKKGRKGSGLLAEMQGVERFGRDLMEAVGAASAGGVGGGGGGVEVRAEELAEASRRMEEGMGPFERQVREVFHRVVRSRAEVIRCLDQSNRSAAAPFLVP